MRPSRRHLVLALALLHAARSAALAQPVPPRIGYVYPAGARQGATSIVTVGGQSLTGVRAAYVSGGGVQAAVLEHVRPVTQRELNDLRERLRQLQAAARGMRNPATMPATMKEITDIRLKIAMFFQRMTTPALSETVTLEVTVAPDAAPGEREVRLATPNGLSNPLVFCVGQFAEFSERASTDTSDLSILRSAPSAAQQRLAAPSPERRITLPATVNGQILPGQVDRLRFTGTKGQRLVVAVRARSLVPYLADGVPGWFQAAVGLYDANQNELAFADHFQFHADPAFFCELPADGDYVLEVRDVIYRGRDDFVYRITAGEVPFVTGIFPLGGRAGTQTAVELAGWNLPVKHRTEDARNRTPGISSLSVRAGNLVSNPVPFAVGDLPECSETAGNNSPERAQPVALPVVVNGRVDRPGEWDVFRFEARAGDEVVAEVHARRLGSPLDSVLKLTDARGTVLASSDDCEDKASGLNTHHADSYLRTRLPATGPYFLHLGDVERRGGAERAYRLRISAPRPDFDLRVVPSSVHIRGGWSAPLTVQVIRHDGFAGEIALALRDAPGGFVLGGARVPANADEVRVTLTAPPTPSPHPVRLAIEGTAAIDGRAVVRPAVPAEDMMQAFAWRHLVPAQDLAATVAPSLAPRALPRVLTPAPLVIPAGGTARLRVGLPAAAFAQVRFELSDPPEGIAIQRLGPVPGGTEIVVTCDAAKAKPGLTGNLIFTAFVTPRPPASQPAGQPRAVPRRVSPGTLSAVPFEVVDAHRAP